MTAPLARESSALAAIEDEKRMLNDCSILSKNKVKTGRRQASVGSFLKRMTVVTREEETEAGTKVPQLLILIKIADPTARLDSEY